MKGAKILCKSFKDKLEGFISHMISSRGPSFLKEEEVTEKCLFKIILIFLKFLRF